MSLQAFLRYATDLIEDSETCAMIGFVPTMFDREMARIEKESRVRRKVTGVSAATGTAVASDGVINASDGVINASDGVTIASDGVTIASDGVTNTSDGVTNTCLGSACACAIAGTENSSRLDSPTKRKRNVDTVSSSMGASGPTSALPAMTPTAIQTTNATNTTAENENTVKRMRIDGAPSPASKHRTTGDLMNTIAAVTGLAEQSHFRDSRAARAWRWGDALDSVSALRVELGTWDVAACMPTDINDQSFFVRHDADEPLFMRAVLVGRSGTPYAHGCFLFDIMLPVDYPDVPPLLQHTTPGMLGVEI